MFCKLLIYNKKIIGFIIIIIYLITYCLIASSIGEWLIINNNTWWRIIYFTIAGLIWIPPVIKLIYWMNNSINK